MDNFALLYDLLEKAGVKLLSAAVNEISYRNNNAALIFLKHIATVLHDNLLKKLKENPVLDKYSWPHYLF